MLRWLPDPDLSQSRTAAAVDSEGRTIWIVDPHRDDGKRFVVCGDEKPTAFLELESAIRGPDFALTSR